MTPPLRNLLLSTVLIALPATGFTMTEVFLLPPAPAASAQASPGLGDVTAYSAIVSDTQAIAATGDLTAAEQRITDLETLWDQNAGALRQQDRAAWGAVDGAADDAFSALRAPRPDPARVAATLAALQGALAHPVPAAANGPVQHVNGIAVTDESGRALPCEDLVGQLQDSLSTRTASAQVADLLSRALERCTADDDARADAFAAQGLSLIQG
ncbi:hypothetical protein [Nioella nitratireducens]|uniref:hypothetical protein n=1 Tax=Nioella nitratireducens TaxID=1287720 RepID=UPI0011BA8F27|nr:hypothetical protein [Nioella nitratireducens]